MTPFNHLKYHFTRGISIPSGAAGKTKAHQMRPSKSSLGDWEQPGTSHTRQTVNLQREPVSFGVKWLNEKRFYYHEIVQSTTSINTVQASPFWFTRLGLDSEMATCSLVAAWIQDSVFCSRNVSMSKLFAAHWNNCPHWCLKNTFSKSWYRLPGICNTLHPVFIDSHKVNSNPGTATNHSLTHSACNCSIIDL